MRNFTCWLSLVCFLCRVICAKLLHNCLHLDLTVLQIVCMFAFCALTLLEEHPVCKNWVMRCWCGYLSEAKCRLFAYGPADATASQNPIIRYDTRCYFNVRSKADISQLNLPHGRSTIYHLLPHLNPDPFYLSGTGLPRFSWKRGR